MADEHGVIVKLAANDDAFRETLGGLGETFLKGLAGINPAVGAVIGIIGGIGIAAVEVAGEYEEATNTIIAKTGATGDALNGLKDDWEAVFKADGAHNAEEIANAIGDVNVRLGLTGEPLQKAAKGFLDLGDNLKESVQPLLVSTTQAMNAWGIESSKTTDIQDKLLVVHQKTGASVTELASSLSGAQPVLKQFGLSFEESATLLGEFQKAGVSGEAAIGSLKKAIVVLGTEGTAPSKEALMGLIDSIKNAGTESAGNAEAVALFGKKGAEMAQIIRDGKVDIDSLSDALANSKGAVEAMDSSTDSFSEKMTQLWRNVSSVLEPLGTGLIDAGKSALDAINGLFSGTSSLNGIFQSVQTTLAPLIDSFRNHYLPVLQDIGQFVVGFLINAFGGLIDILKVLWSPILTTGIDLFQKYLLPVLNTVYDSVSSLIGVLKNVPGFSQVFKDGADAIALVTPKTKDATDATKGLNDAHTTLTGTLNNGTHPALISITAALKEKKAQEDLSKKAVSDLESAETTLHEALQKLVLPVIKSVTDSQKDLSTARQHLIVDTDNLKLAEDRLKTLQESGKASSQQLKAAIDQLDTAKKAVKTSTENLSEAEKNLTASQKDAKERASDMEAALRDVEKVMKDVKVQVPDLSGGIATIASVTAHLNAQLEDTATVKAYRANQALKALGIEPQSDLQALADKAVANFKTITDSGLATAEQVRLAHISELQVIQDAYTAAGTTVPASNQILLTALTQQEKDYRDNSVTAWATMWNTIHDSVADIFKTLNNDIVTGNWKGFKDHIIGDLQSIGEAVVSKFLKPAEDAIESFIANTLTNLLSGKGFGGVMDDLGKIGDSIAGIFKTAAPAATTAVNAGTQAATTAANAGSSAASAGSSAASSGSSAASGALGSIASVTGIVTGVITAGAGVYADAVLTNIKDCLNDMRNDTKFNSWVWDQGGGHEALLQIKNNIDNFVNGAFGGWYHDYLIGQGDLAAEWNDRTKDFVPAIKDGISMVTGKLDTLISQSSVVVNVKAYIDGKEVASVVETQIENAVRLALA